MSAGRNPSGAVLDFPSTVSTQGLLYTGPGVEFWLGDSRDILARMPEQSIQAAATSPPYYGLRQYDSEASIWGAKGDCDHEWDASIQISIHDSYNADFNERWGQGSGQRKQERAKPKLMDQGCFCKRCGAWQGRLGNEPYPQMFLDNLMEIFDPLLRVIRDDGTLWVVIGDSYAGSGRGPSGASGIGQHQSRQGFHDQNQNSNTKQWRKHPGWWGLPDKCLMMIPARFAIEMQKRGWVLRNEVVWDKPNVIPASVNDRLTVNHEAIYLFSRKPKYYFDIEAIKEPIADGSKARYRQNIEKQTGSDRAHAFGQGHDGPLKAVGGHDDLRQKRTVWRISTRSSDISSEHTATFPPLLVEPMILASTSAAGACPKCGAPFERMKFRLSKAAALALSLKGERSTHPIGKTVTYGWKPTCKCGCQAVIPTATEEKICGAKWRVLTPSPCEMVLNERTNKYRKVVTGPSTERFECSHELSAAPCRMLDLFGGYGTLVAVARKHNRHGVYIDVSEVYAQAAVRRAERTQPGLGLF